jgi:hypothetical protein
MDCPSKVVLNCPKLRPQMAEIKPLPIPPVGNEITALTIDAITHVSDVIRYSLKARSLSPAWERPLDMAVKEFSKLLTIEVEFLHDTRSSRQATILKAAQDTASLTDTSNDSDASLGADTKQVASSSKQEPIRLLYTSLQSQSHGTRHLLVTVAAPPAAVTAQDFAFHVIPASQGCIFEPSSFHLPFFEDADGTTLGDGGSVICGLDSELFRALGKQLKSTKSGTMALCIS